MIACVRRLDLVTERQAYWHGARRRRRLAPVQCASGGRPGCARAAPPKAEPGALTPGCRRRGAPGPGSGRPPPSGRARRAAAVAGFERTSGCVCGAYGGHLATGFLHGLLRPELRLPQLLGGTRESLREFYLFRPSKLFSLTSWYALAEWRRSRRRWAGRRWVGR
jgi:hypothetical protein